MRVLPSRSALHELASQARLAVEVPKLLGASRWSPARLLQRRAETIGERPAVLFEDAVYSWLDVDEACNRWAHWFRGRGVQPGDVVAILLDNRPEYLFAQLGLSRLGAVAALVNTHLEGRPLAHALTIAAPRLVLVGTEHLATLTPLVDEIGRHRVVVCADGPAGREVESELPVVDDEVAACSAARPRGLPVPHGDDTSSLIYTSGTTGLPKAARIKNARVMGAAAMFGRVMYDAHPGDVIYVTLPLYHSNAQWMGWGACLLTGATMALRRKFSASRFWPDVRRHRATHFLYIGEVCRYLVNLPPAPAGVEERDHGLRMGVGNGLRADVWRAFQARYGVPLLREFYGATEGNAILTNVEGRPGMIGRLQIVHAVIACDPTTGEPTRDARGRCIPVEPGGTGLFVSLITPFTRFPGYLDAAATEKKVLRDVRVRGDAWVNSGDLMTVHDDGWVSFADRVGDTYRWKGENVSTTEVALVLDGAPGVIASNVYGVTVPGAEGRVGMASVSVDDRFDPSAFAAFVDGRLPGFQRPAFVRVLREMDVTGTFKQRKVEYQREGYDPALCADPLYFLDGGRAIAIDGAFHARLRSGEVGPR